MSIQITTPTSEAAISVDEVKRNSNIPHNDDDVLIASMIEAASEYIEKYCGIALIERTGTIYFDCFTDVIYFPISPIKNLTSISYIDNEGNNQTVDNSIYKIDYYSNPAKVSLKDGKSWPLTANELNSVFIDTGIGYGNASTVPQALKQALLLIVDHWYEHRGVISELTLSMIPELNLQGMLSRYRTHIL